MAALPNLITVSQYLELPDDPARQYELHHGEIVEVTRPKHKHSKLQLRLQELLQRPSRLFGKVSIEYPYRPVAEFELRAADVAVISKQRWDAIDPDDFLRGAPELVIEVKSPSNTKAELRELVALCLANGCQEFWVVDGDKESVTILKRDGSSAVYAADQKIPLALFGGEPLVTADIFHL